MNRSDKEIPSKNGKQNSIFFGTIIKTKRIAEIPFEQLPTKLANRYLKNLASFLVLEPTA